MSQDPERFARELASLGGAELEVIRLDFVRHGDARLSAVIDELTFRGVATLRRAIAELGEAAQLSRRKVDAAIRDATVRLMLKLGRDEHLSAIDVLARQLAVDCVAAQDPNSAPRRLTPEPPDLRDVSDALSDDIGRGRRPNDWRNS